ncbi:hypothetical protein [Photobacterium gaetbulicola]|uniref:hypothetical protein n=1 Tax=Photobacterium gaetbulicola TaxID=1295392 RepID=UPI00068F3FCA|nr:hypothetical protein [Photobacterium gaetbulicola]
MDKATKDIFFIINLFINNIQAPSARINDRHRAYKTYYKETDKVEHLNKQADNKVPDLLT